MLIATEIDPCRGCVISVYIQNLSRNRKLFFPPEISFLLSGSILMYSLLRQILQKVRPRVATKTHCLCKPSWCLICLQMNLQTKSFPTPLTSRYGPYSLMWSVKCLSVCVSFPLLSNVLVHAWHDGFLSNVGWCHQTQGYFTHLPWFHLFLQPWGSCMRPHLG